MTVVWHGDQGESDALLAALGSNCECSYGPGNFRTSTCAAHQAMTHDQRFLDGLIFVRRMAERFEREEFVTPEGSFLTCDI